MWCVFVCARMWIVIILLYVNTAHTQSRLTSHSPLTVAEAASERGGWEYAPTILNTDFLYCVRLERLNIMIQHRHSCI